MNPKRNRPLENLIEGLSRHAKFLSREERKAELRARGIDADAFLTEAHSIIAHRQKESRLAWMNDAKIKALKFKESESGFASWIGKSREEIVAAYQRVANTLSPEHTLAFRNKGELSLDDMARILDDYERLRRSKSDNETSPDKP